MTTEQASNNTVSNRDKIRAATLGRSPQFRRKIIKYSPPKYKEVKDSDGNVVALELVGFDDKNPIEVEVRQPTVKQRNDLLTKCRRADGSGVDEMEFILQCAIRFVYDPVSGERIYDEKDYDALISQPAGDFVDQFGGEAIELLSLGNPEKKSANSSKTTSDKQS